MNPGTAFLLGAGMGGAIFGALINVIATYSYLAKAKEAIRYGRYDEILGEAFVVSSATIIVNTGIAISLLVFSIIQVLLNGAITATSAFSIGYGIGAIISVLMLRVSAYAKVN